MIEHFEQASGVAQLAAVLLTFFGVYRRLGRVLKEIRGLAARVADLEDAQFGDRPVVTPAKSRIAKRVAQRAARVGAALVVVLAALMGAPAGALEQVNFSSPGTGGYPVTIYRKPQIVYGVRIRQYLPSEAQSGQSPVTLEVTSLAGIVSNLVVTDASVFAMQTRKLRLLAGPNVGNYYIDLFTDSGEVASAIAPPPLPINTAPRDFFDTAAETGRLLDAGTLTSTDCSDLSAYSNIAATSPSGSVATNVVLRFDSFWEPALRYGEHVAVEVEGRNSGDTALAQLTGSPTVQVYYREVQAAIPTVTDGGTPMWHSASGLQQTIPTGTSAWSGFYDLTVPGFYCFIPTGATGADKVRIRIHVTTSPRQ